MMRASSIAPADVTHPDAEDGSDVTDQADNGTDIGREGAAVDDQVEFVPQLPLHGIGITDRLVS